jgi:hypothetical protein
MSMMRSVLIVGGTVAFGVSLIVVWAAMSRPAASERAPITYVELPSEIVDLVALDGPNIATAENFVGNRIRVIGGRVQNTGDRPVRSIQLRLVFEDYDGATVLRFEGEALRSTLPPGDNRDYEFRFENLPDEWNFRIPVVEILRLGY